MAKAGWLTILVQRREFLLRFGATVVAILGVVSAALGIADVHFNAGGLLVLVGATFAISFFFNAKFLISPQLIVGDLILSEVHDDFFVTVHCPCDRKLADEAKRLAGQCFATTFTIAPEIYEQLRVKNPYILACMTDGRGTFLGYFDVIPVKEAFAAPLIKGTITEASITHEDVLAPDEMGACEYLFLAGFAVRNPDTYAGKLNANVMAWASVKYLERFYGSGRPFAFAVAATKAGDQFLRKFRLNLEASGVERLDKNNLYSIVMTRKEILLRLSWMLDWSGLCRLDWIANGVVARGQRPRRPRRAESKTWRQAPRKAIPVSLR
jgi:hypothetical protein